MATTATRGQGDRVNLDEAAAENERRRIALTGTPLGGNLPSVSITKVPSPAAGEGEAGLEGLMAHVHVGWSINSDPPVLIGHLAADHGVEATEEDDPAELHLTLHAEVEA